MTETTGATLRTWLLTALLSLGGHGYRSQVHQAVQDMFEPRFNRDDRAARHGRRGEHVWQNNLDSLYDRLKKEGVCEPSIRGGEWTLSPTGLREAEQARATVSSSLSSDDLLANFHPKTSDEYRAHVRGRLLIKQRSHEALLRSYGHGMAAAGWSASTRVHPRDLELQRSGETYLVEVKVLYNGNATAAVREALAQLWEYRHFFYSGSPQPGMLAVFSQPVGDAFVMFLQSAGIDSAWAVAAGWDGSADAKARGLVPRV